MRELEAQQIWEQVYKRRYSLRIAAFRCQNWVPLGSQNVAFQGGITAICGANGVGKTSLLRIIEQLLLSQPSSPAQVPVREGPAGAGGTPGAEIDVVDGAGNVLRTPITVNVEVLREEAVAGEVTFIDPIESVLHQHAILGQMTNIGELLESVEPRFLNEDELAQLTYVLRRDYDEVAVWELSELGTDGDVTPYFRVKVGDATYDSLHMGQGELSVHTIMWQLSRLPRDSILLIEEPETFIAPFSQVALLNEVAKHSVERGIWVLITTHSPDLLRSVPLEQIRLITRVAGRVSLGVPKRESDLREALGLAVPVRGVIFVEDRIARLMVRAILERFTFRWGREFDVVDAGSDGNVIAVLRTIPRAVPRLRFVGVLDGDRVGKIPTSPWPCLAMPGGGSPEEVLRTVAESHTSRLADVVGRSEEDVLRVLGGIAGIDPHDWLFGFASQIGLSIEQAVLHLFAVWIESPEVAEKCEAFVRNISEACEERTPEGSR